MLTERQKIILQILVDDYIRSAEPVGSRTISKRPDISISSATIRNEMADLEELGYLEQPHTSAGRIPSQKGYRFYVDHLMELSGKEETDLNTLRTDLLSKIDEREQVVQQTASILSNLTHYTSIVLGPQLFTTKLRHIQLLPLQERTAVVILVTDTGQVENRKVTIPDGVSIEMIMQYIELLNRKLIGLPMHKLKSQLYSEIASELRSYTEQYDELITLFDSMLEGDKEEHSKVYLGGTTMILNQPEFRDIDKLKPLLTMFEHAQDLAKLMESAKQPESGILVRIGNENLMETIQDCSLVTATYSIGGVPAGAIGVLGPTRMDYKHVITVMHSLSQSLSRLLTQLNK